jgi:LysR family cys regulon transcriptional activator
MNLHQFRFVLETVKQQLNLTEAAKALHTSQPGISKAIIELEEELGIQIFARHGKRIRRITEPGYLVIKSIEMIMRETANLKKIGQQYSTEGTGRLSIATTHTQARYVLPTAITKLRESFAGVNITLHQGSPHEVAKMLLDDSADIGIATESLSSYPDLVTLPCYQWQHVLVLPGHHHLAQKTHVTIEDLALEPLITYHPSYTGRSRIDQAFASKKLNPRIALEAIDSDVIKTYVKTGLGIGIVAEMAVQETFPGGGPEGLTVIPLGHIFGQNVTRIAFKRGAYLPNFVYKFAEFISPRLSKELILLAMHGDKDEFEL